MVIEMEGKFLYILRGVPGCGKTALANTFADIVLEADQYWYVNGEYRFDGARRGEAHKDCQRKCLEAMQKGIQKIAIANTSSKSDEMKPYRQFAELYGYTVFIIIVENRHDGINEHKVPEGVLKQMEENIRNSIQLR